jgi:hypothetical protein
MRKRAQLDLLRTTTWPASLIAVFSGCGLIVPSPPDAEAGVAQHDAGPDDGGAPPVTMPHDASQDASAAVDADAGTAACHDDADCPASAYCSLVSQRCEQRCDATNGCIGPTIAADNNRIATDGTHVCYADDDREQGSYVIRAWDGSASEPTTIGRGANARVLLVADGYCYFSAPSLSRAPLAGGPAEPLGALENAPRRAWLTADFVWWAAPRGELLDIYRRARGADAESELVASVPGTNLWEAGNSRYLFRRFKPTFASCAVVMAPIDELASETTIPMSFSKNCSGALWASEDSILFTQFEPVHYYPFRVDLANPSVETTLRLHSQELLMYQVRGAWIYGQSVVDGASVVGVPNTVSYQRAGLDGSATERLFTPTPGTAAYTVNPFELDDNVYRTFAVLEQQLVYQHLREFRLIVAPLRTDEADSGPPP